jgi:hypothetical protein
MIRVAGPPSAHRYGDDLDVEVLLNDETRIVVGKDSRGHGGGRSISPTSPAIPGYCRRQIL